MSTSRVNYWEDREGANIKKRSPRLLELTAPPIREESTNTLPTQWAPIGASATTIKRE